VKVIFVIAALISSFMLLFLSGAEGLFTSEGPFRDISNWDATLEVVYICCCIWAFSKPIAAVVVAWGAIAIRVLVGLLFGLPGYRLQGALRYSAIPALCLALAAWADYRRALRLDRPDGSSEVSPTLQI
jgi:hypothetical protein